MSAALTKTIESLAAEFGAALQAVWVGGSLALGDFDERRSDVDLAIILSPRPAQGLLLPQLAKVHAMLIGSTDEWLHRIEAFYFSPDDLKPWQPGRELLRIPAVEAGNDTPTLEEVGPEIALYQHVLREHGACLFGASPSSFIAPVPAPTIRAGARWVVERWVTGWFRNPEQLEPPPFRSFAALTCCRLLYTLETGGVASKPAAARWAASNLHGDPGRAARRAADTPGQHGSEHLAVEDAHALIRHTLLAFGARP